GQKGSEAAKETAELVLADDNFASIAAAVREGRTVYDNLKKVISFLLPVNGGESLSLIIAILLGLTLPITPVQILWVNMVTAVTLGLALAFEPAEENVMARAPRDPKEPILTRFLVWRVVFVSLLLVSFVFGAYLWFLDRGAEVELARTMAVNLLVAGEIAYLFNIRNLHDNALSLRGLFGSRPALIATGLVVAAQVLYTDVGFMQDLFGSTNLSLWQWGLVAATLVVVFLIIEAEKAIFRRLGKR
ncbi:MAG: cation transporting ATPase C-terminal domain-containing protein, partial [Opitutales bacterium]